MKPLILINFKMYKEALGNNSLALAKKIDLVDKRKYEIAVAPSLLMIKEIAEHTKLPVFAQHADPVLVGAHTGSISIEELKLLGVQGVILNHSEKKVPLSLLTKTIKMCKNKKLETIVCASNLAEVRAVAKLSPGYIAYEPNELIGGNVSVTETKPEVIVTAVELVNSINRKIKLLCGAGIHSPKDLSHALWLGAQGVIIGHAVPKSKDPQKFLKEMLM